MNKYKKVGFLKSNKNDNIKKLYVLINKVNITKNKKMVYI